MSILGPTVAIVSAALGVGLLRTAWARNRSGRALTVAGWLLLLSGAGLWQYSGLGWDKASAFAALVPSLIAFGLLARQAEWRGGPTKVRRKRQPPRSEPGPRNSFGRGAARFILAGPMALAAASALAAAVALRMPWPEADRLVTAGLLLPIAWATGAVWATMEESLIRVAVVLSAATVALAGGSLL